MICPSCQAENTAGADVCFTCGRALSALTQGSLIGGRYEIQGVLGKGGMGMVYRAHDCMLDEVVAIKVLRQELAATPAMAERFRSEIKLARKVSHPNVCRIHEYGEDAGMSFISMELLEGVDLKHLLAGTAGLPPAEAYSAALQLAKGLAAIHEMGIIHRDLKTPNALRDPAGVIKLMDFGIAKDAEGGSQTATGEVMGTPEYMSPEQCRGEKLDARSDIYALGIVIYELFTGEVPFRGENMMATLFKQIGEPAAFDGPVGSRVPRALVPVIEKALAKDRDKRYQKVAELYAGIKDAHRKGDAVAPPPPAPADAKTEARSEVRPQPPPPDGPERRTHNRLEMHLNVFLCRLDSEGGVLHQERTVADNISRNGARVMTCLPDLEPGDSVILKEVGGDFNTKALVRHAHVGPDHIPRVGLEFVGQAAPDRLVLTDGERVQTLRPGLARAASPAKPARPTTLAARVPTSQPSPGSVPAGGAERRRHTRLAISVDIQLRRLRADGSTEREERTVADNISRGGARVLTSMADIKTGDRIWLREIGGDFETEALVRNTFVGPDRIPRLGLEFLGKTAPGRLVPTSAKTRRVRLGTPATNPAASRPEPGAGDTARASVDAAAAKAAVDAAVALEEQRRRIREIHSSITTKNHFEFLGIDRGARENDVKHAYTRLAKQYHPDAARDAGLSDLQRELSAIFVRLSEAYDVLRDPEKRGRYESRLGPRTAAERAVSAAVLNVATTPPEPQKVAGPQKPAAPPVPPPVPPPATPPPPPEPETKDQRTLRLETAIRKARQHFVAAEYWDVIQLLEPYVDEASGTRLGVSIHLLLAQAMSKNPKWLKASQELVMGVVREDPRNVEAHFLLGTLYKQAGLAARARTALRKVLELQPGHPGASAELAALDSGKKGSSAP